MINEVKNKVLEILNKDLSGHGIDHIERVYKLAIEFAKKEKADIEIVSFAALLHDVDDYKIVGKENANKFTNAKRIMNEVNIDKKEQEKIIDIIKNMGYSKSLKGIRPKTLEGMCVSDADMCDALGARGIIRSIIYAVSNKGNGVIFDKNIYPKVNITAEEYNHKGTTHDTDGAINHIFEKVLKLKGLMMTNAGKKEASIRHEFIVGFLKEFFREEYVPEWQEFLNKYLKSLE